MKYFLISVTNACDKSCDYCVVKHYRNNPNYPDKASAQDIVSFFQNHINPDVVEITGGEPTLYFDLLPLLDWLKEHKTKVILRTNGIRLDSWRENYPNMIVILIKHDSDDSYMLERKKFLFPCDIVMDRLPDESVAEKEKTLIRLFPKHLYPMKHHEFSKCNFITNDGVIRTMHCTHKTMGTIWDFRPHPDFICKACPQLIAAWNLISRLDSFLPRPISYRTVNPINIA